MSKPSDKQRATEELDVWHSVKDVDAASVPAAQVRQMRPPEPKLVMVERDYELDITYPPPPPAGFLTKLWTKCKKEPLIPIGFLATAGILATGVISMGGKDKKRQQQLMRARVAAQAFTVVAFMYGVWSVGQREKKTGVSRYQRQADDAKKAYSHETD